MTKFKKISKFKQKLIAEQNKSRNLAGLSPIKIKVVKCNACDKSFETTGDRNCGCTQPIRVHHYAGYDVI